MGLRDRLRRRRPERSLTGPFGLPEWVAYLNALGGATGIVPANPIGEKQEEPAASFAGYANQAYAENGVVFACMLVRMLLFSEARFQFRQMRGGRPGDLFGTSELELLERPWPGATTGDLLTRMIQDADLAGNFYGVRRQDRLYRLVPSWVTIVLGSKTAAEDAGEALDAEVVGYVYKPGGTAGRGAPVALLPEEMVHFAPIPDPLARFRGMSWLTPIVREIMGDKAATVHKLRFFERGTSKNLAVKLDKSLVGDKFQEAVRLFKEAHADLEDVYRTFFLGGGADVTVIGSDLQQADYKEVVGAGETRIAAAAGVPPVIVGLSEGLAAATYSNYSQARRRFADGTMRPLWRNAAGSLAGVLTVPAGSELWYDDRDIPFLQEDEKDAAEIIQVQASTISGLVKEGFTPESAKAAVIAGDLARLEHTGLVSVQLQPPGQALPDSQDTPPADGSLNGRAEPLPIERV